MNVSNKFNHIKAIFFDTGDTLYTNEEMEKAYPKKLRDLVVETRGISKEEAKQLIDETAAKLKGTVKHVTKVRTMAELGFTRPQVHEAFCKVNPKEFLSPDPELDLLMANLSKKYKLGIISNFKRSHILEILEALGLSSDWFPLLVTEDIVQEIKPDHEPFLKAIEISGFLPTECLYVGDSPTKDMLPAKEVGMMTVLIAQNSAQEDTENADAVIGDVKEITSILF